MESASELVGLFEKCQKATSMRMALAKMGDSQSPTIVATDNTMAKSIVNGTEKQNIFIVIDMIFYWVRYIIQKNHFRIFWWERRENLADYVTKHYPICHHGTMRPICLKATKKDIEN